MNDLQTPLKMEPDKLYVMKLNALPPEILEKIFGELSLFDLERVSITSKQFRFIVKKPSFGLAILRKEAPQLKVELSIMDYISGLDTFAIASVGNGTNIVVLYSGLESRVYFVHTSLTGRTETWHEKSNEPCYCLISGSTLNHNFSSCAFCAKYNISEFQCFVDKRYRVFFQTWEDQFWVLNSWGSQVGVFIRHWENRNGWEQPKPITRVQSFRYGLLILPQDIAALESLWKIPTFSTPKVSSENDNPDSEQLWNPWI
jgi:hypothetical protein